VNRWIVASVALAALLVAASLAACREAEGVDFSAQVPDGAPQIDQHGLQFDPTSLTVSVGETVYITNSESALHRVEVDGEDISGNMERGDVVAYTFDAPGEYRLTCTYHPQQRATVTVE
jgi:plastocyanin